MNVYAVIAQDATLDALVESNFDDSDRCKLHDGVWMVRSSRLTNSEVLGDLGVKPDLAAIAIKAQNYDGRSHREIVQKLAAWESE